jgi:lipopolysaccharide transport system permease protein
MDTNTNTEFAAKVSSRVVEETRPAPRQSLRSRLIRYRDIIREFAVADFRLRYHNSALGYLWFLLSPLLMFGIYYFVFTEVLYVGIQDYGLYLILGIIGYNFFQDCTFSAMLSLVAKAPIIKKIYFPRHLIIFASSTTGLFSFAVNLAIVSLIVLVIRGFPPLFLLTLIPLVCLLLFSTGVGFLLAILYARFKDINQIWTVLVLAIFWITPVVYNVTALPESTQIIMFLNPLARILMLFRHFLLYDFFDLQFVLITVVASLAVFLLGFLIFRKFQHTLAELL